MASNRRKRTPSPASEPIHNDAALLTQAAEFYSKTLQESPPGLDCLRRLHLADRDLLEPFCCGYCEGTLAGVLPARGPVRERLAALGILEEAGTETLLGCLTFPLYDPEGGILSLAGWDTEAGQTRLPTPSPTGLWNLPAARQHPEILLLSGVVDALSAIGAGLPNVLALVAESPAENDVRLLRELGVQSVFLVGRGANHDPIAGALDGITVRTATLPGDRGPNGLLAELGPDGLAEAIDEAVRNAPAPAPRGPKPPAALPDGFAVRFDRRSYELRGLDKGPRKLKATVRASHAGRLHVDTVDLYSARARNALCRDLSRLYDEAPAVVEADLARLIALAEQHRPPEGDTGEAPAMTEEERSEAEEFGRSPDLINRILVDYETCGLVGERANKLLCYLAAVSRKSDEPLSVLVLSSSGAGKTALQDATLRLCPPEDVVKLTSLTGRALFYKDRHSLRHRILALEEGAGAETATYAIRNLISAGELVIETTVKDLGTGRMTTRQHKVEGPTAVFVTTTDPDTDPETRSRFFVIGVDESRGQTRAILASQRRGQTLAGRLSAAAAQSVRRRHWNLQRLLRPVAVVNPHAEELGYADDRLQGRRDQLKYLNLIKAVAFLRQLGKPLKQAESGGKLDYIEADMDDVRVANDLACQILGRTLDDLNAVSRDLLMHLDRMVPAFIFTFGTWLRMGIWVGSPFLALAGLSLAVSRTRDRAFLFLATATLLAATSALFYSTVSSDSQGGLIFVILPMFQLPFVVLTALLTLTVFRENRLSKRDSTGIQQPNAGDRL